MAKVALQFDGTCEQGFSLVKRNGFGFKRFSLPVRTEALGLPAAPFSVGLTGSCIFSRQSVTAITSVRYIVTEREEQPFDEAVSNPARMAAFYF